VSPEVPAGTGAIGTVSPVTSGAAPGFTTRSGRVFDWQFEPGNAAAGVGVPVAPQASGGFEAARPAALRQLPQRRGLGVAGNLKLHAWGLELL